MTREEKQIKKFNNLIQKNKVAYKLRNEALKKLKVNKTKLNQHHLKLLLGKNFPKLFFEANVTLINKYSKIVFSSKNENGSTLDFLSISFTKDLKTSTFENTFNDCQIITPPIIALTSLSLNQLIFIGKVSYFILKNKLTFIQHSNKLLVNSIKKLTKYYEKVNKKSKIYIDYQQKITDFLTYELYYRAKNEGGIDFITSEDFNIFVRDIKVSNPIKLKVIKILKNYYKLEIIDKNKNSYFFEDNNHVGNFLVNFIASIDNIKNWPYQIK